MNQPVSNTDMLLGGVSELKKDNEFLRSMQQLFQGKNKDIDMITQLEPHEVLQIARIRAMQEWAEPKATVKGNIPVLEVFIQAYMRMKVSERRKGRMEFFETFRPVLANLTAPAQPGFFSRMFNRNG